MNQHVIAGPGRFDGQEFRADALIAAVPVQAWRTISAGKGAKGDRLYDWARVRVHGVNFPDSVCWFVGPPQSVRSDRSGVLPVVERRSV